MCLPIGYGISSKRDLSVFNNIADTGAFVKSAALLIAGGLIAIGLSHFTPERGLERAEEALERASKRLRQWEEGLTPPWSWLFIAFTIAMVGLMAWLEINDFIDFVGLPF
jgi:hypothetical protein